MLLLFDAVFCSLPPDLRSFIILQAPEMAEGEAVDGAAEGRLRRAGSDGMMPLAQLIGEEARMEKVERPRVRYGCAAQSKKGEDYFLFRTDCQRIAGDPSSSFSVFAVFDGHNGNAAAIYTRDNLLNHVMGAIPSGLSREEWVQALPRALVAGFVKTDKEFQRKGQTSGTTVTFVIINGWTITVASVGDSRCILDARGVVSALTVDHRLEENVEERERVTASGGEVGRLNVVGGVEIGPLRCWPGGLCLSRSIGDMDVGEFIVPVPFVKQVKLSNAGGRLIIASDGIWDALTSEMAANSCRGLPAELAARQVVKEALRTRGLKDDTTCIVVDIAQPDHSEPPPSPPRKTNKFKSFIFRKKSKDSANKLSKKLSSVSIVEEIFEEGSAMLSERRRLLQVKAYQFTPAPSSLPAQSHGKVPSSVSIAATKRMLWKENAQVELKCFNSTHLSYF
ncbi:probable protein phosphatase 2C 15 isoform X2 [Zingiber officinale]|uniref:probable protein phosphatase 2C 15 isoform X2 n=1 Tax=Zingiber officinale TaxID=94328 RepID=UPI001C4C3815|nr:probable protein phosphatase 2C 15 isoform X2 [Zingiber officinale]